MGNRLVESGGITDSREECTHLNWPHVVVVGGGPCGISAACHLLTGRRPLEVTLLERSSGFGVSGPFNEIGKSGLRLGAQMLSFDISEASVGSCLSRLTSLKPPVIECCDETKLSETTERPRGWSRRTGQWQHYYLHDGFGAFSKFLHGMVHAYVEQRQESPQISLKFDSSVTSLAIASPCDPEATDQWAIQTRGGSEYTCDAVILALPPGEIYELLAPLNPDFVPQSVLHVLEKAASAYTARYACLLTVSQNSKMGAALLSKFSQASADGTSMRVRELDVANVEPKIMTLISLVKSDSNSLDRQLAIKGSGILRFVLHSLVELSNWALSKWLASWLAIELELIGATGTEAFSISNQCIFHQAGFTHAPLSPLPERGCIVIGGSQTQSPPRSQPILRNEEQANIQRQPASTPPIILCGDWAAGSGTVSAALLSGEKAAKNVLASIV